MPNKLKLILIVDDSPINLMGTSQAVRALGYTVYGATSGQEALVRINERSYAAILMDVNMPEMSGLACTEKIRDIEIGTLCRTPIIAFTSERQSTIAQDCSDAGMDAFLDKACSPDELATTLKLFAKLPGLVA